MKKVLIFPAAFQAVKNYGGYEGCDIWLKSFSRKNIPAADYYVGHSGGVNFILSNYDFLHGGKFIFINPQIEKKNIAVLFRNWIRFFFSEGIKKEKIVPIKNRGHGIKSVWKLLKVDVWKIIQKIPKGDLIIVRGVKDDYFRDKKSAEVIKNYGIKLVEVEAGHDWNDEIARAVRALVYS